MSWATYVEMHASGDVNKVIAANVGVTESAVSRWRTAGQAPRADHVAKFARAYSRPVLEAFVAAGFLTPEEAGAQVVIQVDPLDEYDDLELLDALRARHIERVTTDAEREDGGEHVRSASITQPSPAGDAEQPDGEVLSFKHPPDHEWTDDVQRNLDEPAKAARRGKPALPPDTTTGEESQVPPEDRDPA